MKLRRPPVPVTGPAVVRSRPALLPARFPTSCFPRPGHDIPAVAPVRPWGRQGTGSPVPGPFTVGMTARECFDTSMSCVEHAQRDGHHGTTGRVGRIRIFGVRIPRVGMPCSGFVRVVSPSSPRASWAQARRPWLPPDFREHRPAVGPHATFAGGDPEPRTCVKSLVEVSSIYRRAIDEKNRQRAGSPPARSGSSRSNSGASARSARPAGRVPRGNTVRPGHANPNTSTSPGPIG